MFVFYAGPENIVGFIGVENSYLLAFLVATIGGVSTFTSTYYYATIITLSVGGLNPFLLGFVSGIGVTIGDSVFFYMTHKGRNFFEHFIFGKKLEFLSKWLNSQPFWMVALISFLYTGFTPFPTDILMIVLALGRYPFIRILPFFLLGNITLVTMLAYFSSL